jgi:NhaP-type Na+/H+ or K+/H+ antiporter
MCFGLAQWLGGSGFIACFVGGLAFGGLTREHKEQFLESAEGTADALALLTWFTFGTIAIGLLFNHFSWQAVIYAVLSLTIVRMLPVYLSLIGKHLQTDTVLFIGWFGPRGLASIVFAVMVAAQHLAGNNTILTTVAWTILLSVVAHGLTANILASRYGSRAEQRGGEL